MIDLQWYGTATLAMRYEGHTILFDPFIPMNSKLKEPFLTQDFSNVNSIVITHGHFDHIIDVPTFLGYNQAKVYCDHSTAEFFKTKGVPLDRIQVIKCGDTIELGPFRLRTLAGKHIKFDMTLMARTFFSKRFFSNLNRAFNIFRLNKKIPHPKVFIFDIAANDLKILHLGSLNIDQEETYPTEIDVMTVPFQGRSDIAPYAVKIVNQLHPKTVLLHHFDDTFPPITETIDPSAFLKGLKETAPDIQTIVPEYFKVINLGNS
ncbi:MAG: MBL fold metallo-hydrolase [Ignavibacteriales bacterium]